MSQCKSQNNIKTKRTIKTHKKERHTNIYKTMITHQKTYQNIEQKESNDTKTRRKKTKYTTRQNTIY